MCTSDSSENTTLMKRQVMNPPNVLFIQLIRFNNESEKVLTPVMPSTNIDFHGSSYKLKSILQHEGAHPHEGHYTTMLYLDNKWVKCNDSNIDQNSTTRDSDGYVYIYELNTESILPSTPLQINNKAPKRSSVPQSNKETNANENENHILKRKTKDHDQTTISKKMKNINKKKNSRSLQSQIGDTI